jgi:hypothetical protein
MAFC